MYLPENISEIIQLASSLAAEEKKVLKLLAKVGASIPAELAVKSFSLPEEINKILRSLREKELISTERGSSSTSGEVIYVSDRGRVAAQFLDEMK